MIIILLILTLSNCSTHNKTSNKFDQVKKYLHEYGYLQGEEDNVSLQSVNETVLSNALLLFQEYYKLPADGKLNNKTQELMSRPRCGNVDAVSDFRVSSLKWNKLLVTWHCYLATQEVLELTEKVLHYGNRNRIFVSNMI